MTEREIRTLRDKIGTDPILTDEEIEYIWMAMDKQEVEHPIREKLQDGSRWYKCQVCGQVWRDEQKYCHYCGQKTRVD